MKKVVKTFFVSQKHARNPLTAPVRPQLPLGGLNTLLNGSNKFFVVEMFMGGGPRRSLRLFNKQTIFLGIYMGA